MKFKYGMTRNYCSTWTVIDAIREISQNALDHGMYRHEIPYISEDHSQVLITSIDAELPREVFAIGESRKDDGAIGKFGEGFKLALLILAREGIYHCIHSGDKEYTGTFEYDEDFGVDTFCIEVEEVYTPTQNIEFFADISNDLLPELKKKITYFEDPLDYGLLKDKPGLIYVNGLFVCEDSRLTYGYNLKPDQLELNRDRNTAMSLEWDLSKFLGDNLDHALTIYKLVMNNAKDISDLAWHLSPAMKEFISAQYKADHGETKYVNTTHTNTGTILANCGIGVTYKPTWRKEAGLKFYEENKKHMRRKARVEFLKLLEKIR